MQLAIEIDVNKTAIFCGIPFPPSENQIYRSFAKGKRLATIKSEKARNYEHEFSLWAMFRLSVFRLAKKDLQGKKLKVFAIYHCSTERLYTKQGKPKRFDLLNLQKIMIDCLFKQLELDDSMIFEFAAKKERIPGVTSDRERVDVFITPIVDQI